MSLQERQFVNGAGQAVLSALLQTVQLNQSAVEAGIHEELVGPRRGHDSSYRGGRRKRGNGCSRVNVATVITIINYSSKYQCGGSNSHNKQQQKD
jgi:hypothetical protein